MVQDRSKRAHEADEESVRVKVEIRSREVAFHDRRTAVEDIELRLRQFDEAGYDQEGDFWWGRCDRGPCQQARFSVR